MAIEVLSAVWAARIGGPPARKLVALALADAADKYGARAFPGQDRLSRFTGLDPRQVRRHVAALIEDGLVIEVETAHPGRRREFRFDLDALRAAADADDRPPENGGLLRSEWGTPEVGMGGPDDRPPVLEPSSTRPKTSSGRSLATAPTTRAAADRLAARNGFDEFWTVYPRRTAKGAARTAYGRALARAPAAHIIEGAARLRDDPNRDPAFTPHPTTWLNQDRWDDDPLPPRGSAPDDQAGRLMRGEPG